MKTIKKVITVMLCAIVVAVSISLSHSTDVHAISFVEFYTSLSGVIQDIVPTSQDEEGKYFVYVDRNDRISRFVVGTDTFVVGKSLEVGDTITVYFGLLGGTSYDSFESVVSDMTPTETPGRYVVRFDHGDNVGDSFGLEFIPYFYVDFNRTFLSGVFEVGDTIRGYYSPWGVRDLFDTPQFPAIVITNGDYNIFMGAVFDGNLVSNSVFGDDGIVLNIGIETEILNRNGEPFAFADELLADNAPWRTHLAVVYNDVADSDPPFVSPSKVIVLQHERLIREMEITIYPQLDSALLIPSDSLRRDRLLIDPSLIQIEPPVVMLPRIVNFDYDTPSYWALEQVMKAVAFDFVPEYLQNNFTQAITRAEFTALAVALYEVATGREITGRMEFNDTDDINVQKMGYLGVVTGVGNGNFAPYDTITREQAAVMLSRLSAVLGHPLSPCVKVPHFKRSESRFQ